jgi:hypothetical protein
MCSRVIGRHPPIIGRIPLQLPTSGPRPTASPRTHRLPSRRTIVRRMCSQVTGLRRPKIGRAPLRPPTSDLRRISSREARQASSPTAPRVRRHQKIVVPRLVRNRRATSMLLPKTTPIRRIRLLPDRTTIRLIKRRRTRRGISCPQRATYRLGFELVSGGVDKITTSFGSVKPEGGTAIPPDDSATHLRKGSEKQP